MTPGVGGQTREAALAALPPMLEGAEPIGLPEYAARVAKAQARMLEAGIAAVYAHAGSNLAYFTGTKWNPSERMVGALIPAEGALEYIAPAFEEGTVRDFMVLPGAVNTWHEHESPYQLFLARLAAMGVQAPGRVGLCEGTPFYLFDGLRQLGSGLEFVNARPVIAHCRMRKSEQEVALIQRAHEMTLAVQKAAASVLHEGISTLEVEAFIQEAHRKVGAKGSFFCIVLFGQATAFPHGVEQPQILKDADMVLIDTGCLVHGYMSDITRSYVFGQPSERQRSIWNAEKSAQAAAFAAARPGTPCCEVDRAVRRDLEANGLGPGYTLPGLPHRTGHGTRLDIHEGPYLVDGDPTLLDTGMCFSSEPMICVPGEFGVRLEDHIHMSPAGPVWFTQPSPSIDDPFGLAMLAHGETK